MNTPTRWIMGLGAVLFGAACGGASSGTPPVRTKTSDSAPAAVVAPTPHVYLGTVYRLPPLVPPAPKPVPTTQPAEASDRPTTDEELEDVLGASGVGGAGLGGGGTVRIGAGPSSTRTGVGLLKPSAPRPQVRVQPPTAVGSLDKSIINRVMRRSLNRLRYCYERELLKHPGISGKVVARFEIDAQGAVVNPTAQGINASMETCVVGVLRLLRFPAPPGGGRVIVSYPFVFRPDDASGPVAPAENQERGCNPVDTSGEQSVFEPVVASVTACYQAALGRSPALQGRAIVELAVDGEGSIADVTVDGAGFSVRDPQLEACIANAVLAVSLTGDQRVALTDHRALFTLGLLRTPEPELAPEPAVITLTPSEVRLGLRLLGTEVPFDRDVAPQRAIWQVIGTALEGHKGLVVLRIDDRVDALAVEMALRSLGAHRGRLRFARALPDDERAWKVVNPLGDVDLRDRCDGPPAGRVSVLVAMDGYWVSSDKGSEQIPATKLQFDTIAFGRHLRELRRFELAGRSDLEISGSMGTPYEALAKAIEIAFETGFSDVRVLRETELKDPRHSRRRSR